jgi:hypothetical protein
LSSVNESGTSQSGFGGWVMKKRFIIHQAACLPFLNSYSLITDQINPASSLAIATTALHGVFPLLTRCQYRFRSLWSAMFIAHCG